MSVFHTREVAAQQAGALFDVALGHTFLQAVVSDGLAYVHNQQSIIQARQSWTA
jgi:hypothetical protein